MLLDPRINSAITTDASAVSTLNQLHQQITYAGDTNALVNLLGTYIALATVRAIRRRSLPSAVSSTVPMPWTVTPTADDLLRQQLITQNRMQMITEAFETVSRIANWGRSTANSLINNIKA